MTSGADLVQMVFGSTSVYVQLLRFFVVFIVGITVIRTVVMPLVRRIAARRGTKKRAKHSLENIVGVIGFFVTFTAALQAGDFGGLVTVIGTVGAAATVAIGWGMRDQVGSLVSGIFMHISPSFVEGDYISTEDMTGTVQETTMIETKLRGPNGQKLVVPNSYLTTRPVTNHTKGTVTQDSLTVKVRPEKLDAARDALKTLAAEYDEVLNSPAPRVLHGDMDGKSVTTELVYYIRDNQDVRQIRSNVIEQFNRMAVDQELLAEPEEEKTADDASA